MRNFGIGFVCLFFLIQPAAADELLKAMMLFDAERYEEALPLLTPLAEAGSLEAQEILHDLYRHGHGVPADQAKAAYWTQRSAEQGHAPAQAAMGEYYLGGTGGAVNEAKAVDWFRRSAQQGDAVGIYNLAVMTLNGQGMAADPENGMRLMRWAAELKSPDALYVMGAMSLQNASSIGNFDSSLDDLTLAAKLGQRRAMALLGFLYEELPEDPNALVKSAFYYQIALGSGCDDVADAAALAVARLTADDLETLDYNMELQRLRAPETDARDGQPAGGACFPE